MAKDDPHVAEGDPDDGLLDEEDLHVAEDDLADDLLVEVDLAEDLLAEVNLMSSWLRVMTTWPRKAWMMNWSSLRVVTAVLRLCRTS